MIFGLSGEEKGKKRTQEEDSKGRIPREDAPHSKRRRSTLEERTPLKGQKLLALVSAMGE